MRKALVLIGLFATVTALPATSSCTGARGSAGVSPLTQEVTDDRTEDACDCCQKCNAARRTVLPEEEERNKEKNQEGNGCKDCCERCGKVMPPAPDETPPERIEKEIPQELKEDERRL